MKSQTKIIYNNQHLFICVALNTQIAYSTDLEYNTEKHACIKVIIYNP